MHREGGMPDLFERIASDEAFGLRAGDLEAASRPEKLVGRCPAQVEQFVREELDPALAGVAEIESAPVRV
jgi:adenylosuccinate lyase